MALPTIRWSSASVSASVAIHGAGRLYFSPYESMTSRSSTRSHSAAPQIEMTSHSLSRRSPKNCRPAHPVGADVGADLANYPSKNLPRIEWRRREGYQPGARIQPSLFVGEVQSCVRNFEFGYNIAHACSCLRRRVEPRAVARGTRTTCQLLFVLTSLLCMTAVTLMSFDCFICHILYRQLHRGNCDPPKYIKYINCHKFTYLSIISALRSATMDVNTIIRPVMKANKRDPLLRSRYSVNHKITRMDANQKGAVIARTSQGPHAKAMTSGCIIRQTNK